MDSEDYKIKVGEDMKVRGSMLGMCWDMCPGSRHIYTRVELSKNKYKVLLKKAEKGDTYNDFKNMAYIKPTKSIITFM